MNFEERIKYYLNDFNNIKDKILVNPNEYSIFKQNEIYYYKGSENYQEDFICEYGVARPGWWWGENGGFRVDFKCLANSADGYKTNGLPVLTKTRIIGEKNNGILMKFAYGRHWNILTNFNDCNKWEDKISDVVWRGTSTTGLDKINNRRTFFKINNYYDKYNVGFVKYEHDFDTLDQRYYKNEMSIHEQLKYKYIICLEGNDVATSLKWSLMSNSVVIMSKPVIESWLMEGSLKPYVHYIPLKDDFSDLDEIIEWCRNNDSKCKEISQNSTNFMKQFMNHEMELNIHNYLKNWYKEHIVFTQ